MCFKVTVTLRNDEAEDVVCVIPRGQVFENKKVGTGLQNLAVARDYRLVIPAGCRITAELQAFCVNQSLRPPGGALGNITVFKIDAPFEDQDDLWRVISTAGHL